jgi:serine/threonine protein kinase
MDIAEASRRSEALREASIMSCMDHSSICKLLCFFEDTQYAYLVMEYLTGGDLLHCIDSEEQLLESEAKDILLQIASALHHAHTRRIVHRDLKPENVCFVRSGRADRKVKLIDWGLAAQLKPFSEEAYMLEEVGSNLYVAPEVLELAFGMRPLGYTRACDLWSLGALSYELICGQNPFYGDYDSMVNGTASFSEEAWSRVSADCKNFVKQLLRAQPEDRPTFEELFQHPFLADVIEKSCGSRAPPSGFMVAQRHGG